MPLRITLPTVAFFALSTLNAQVDINQMIQERMAKQGGGSAHVADDNDPFVPNTFTGSFKLENHHFANGAERKDSPTTMRYWSTPEKTLVKMEMPDQKGQDMRTLTDLKEKWQYMLIDDGKGGRTAMKSRKKKVVMDEKSDVSKTDVTVTDETKVIDGHTCTKVISKSPEGTWTGWVAKDVPGAFQDMARTIRSGDPRMAASMSKLDGMVLEFEWLSADGKDTMHCYVRDLVVGKVDASVFSLDGYNVTEMPSYGR